MQQQEAIIHKAVSFWTDLPSRVMQLHLHGTDFLDELYGAAVQKVQYSQHGYHPEL